MGLELFLSFVRFRFSSYLDTRFRQIDFQRDLFPHEDIGIARLGEQILQNVQLGTGESGALATLLARWYS